MTRYQIVMSYVGTKVRCVNSRFNTYGLLSYDAGTGKFTVFERNWRPGKDSTVTFEAEDILSVACDGRKV